MKKKILLFDFDKTLTKEDTIIILWKYAIEKNKTNAFKYVNHITLGSVKYLVSRNFNSFKNEICQILLKFSDEELEEFADYVYENYMLKDGVEYFKNLDRDYAMLVSASPTKYLKYFKKYLDFDVIMGTELTNLCTIDGFNNKSYEKVRRINLHLQDLGYEIDYENSSAFSDSYSADRPMLELVKNRYLINSKKKIEGYNNLKWY